jgi:hypothetical protein
VILVTGLLCGLVSAVATSGPSSASASVTSNSGLPGPSTTTWSFVSAPALHPMRVTVDKPDPTATPREIFIDPETASVGPQIGQNGALILDNSGNPIWFKPASSSKSDLDFQVQRYQRQPVLTFWSGIVAGSPGHTNLPQPDPEPGADFEIYNDHYRLLKTVTAANGWTADQHEFLITPQGDAIFTVFKLVPMNLAKYGGPSQGFVGDSGVQEIDLATGKLLFSWDMLKHVSPAASEYPASYANSSDDDVWDTYHVNSLDLGPNHQLVISSRNVWAVYDVSMANGKFLWQLGGKGSTFTFSQPGATFAWQHTVRFLPGNKISMFDDGCCENPAVPQPQQQSHGLLLQLDLKNKTATEVTSYFHDPGLQADSEGSYQTLPNGDAFIGWGSEPYYSEYAPAGNAEGDGGQSLLYDVMLPSYERSYRVLREDWVGTPYYRPSEAVRASGSGVNVYVSWNGSTQTVAWRVLGGPSPHSLSVLAPRVAPTGFETLVSVKAVGPYFEVQALGVGGRVLGTSKVVPLSP